MSNKVDQQIRLSDYNYDLPKEKIAKHPLAERMNSKLLVYNEGNINHTQFFHLDDYLPDDANLFFNDTRVIPARLHFKKDTGASIEVFLLEPHSPTNDIAKAMLVAHECEWCCMVGNFKKWKDHQSLQLSLLINDKPVTLTAEIADREKQIIRLKWSTANHFVEIVEAAGKIPLPPYIDRDVSKEDKERYQTIYSHAEGAVAAPTAGLHFSDAVVDKLKDKGVTLNYLTLHVSAGTFQPIKEENVLNHPMHSEQVIVKLENIQSLLNNPKVIAVGTTSMRTLESLYWYGVKLIKEKNADFTIAKLFPYKYTDAELPTTKEALTAIKHKMKEEGVQEITGHTEIFIFPGYNFKVVKGLVTNYHLPGSTLVLLVAAFIGAQWREVYQQALDNDYRFLSYGDSSLLIPQSI
ncbi:S-adenosylmethionine:tRNA ribosyltransferase-isomerase [Fulvivirga sediminis]|uniref:S-adenosylmethionine:tRNA ribosyltransferase-isomerase n=1 Tax=Fulvivirga sediminis TaxID=2803949 RepID=A0A937JZH8_9BACT|nr:S-adenosylmethionine:tRNA ribosyltransferase-isomerase [Fulvivirga sediminis]MBL3655300.1 S-adenosylmethionine:tRNA ribosyltransferase-isomerase [Fulvivirga sediminis]